MKVNKKRIKYRTCNLVNPQDPQLKDLSNGVWNKILGTSLESTSIVVLYCVVFIFHCATIKFP